MLRFNLRIEILIIRSGDDARRLPTYRLNRSFNLRIEILIIRSVLIFDGRDLVRSVSISELRFLSFVASDGFFFRKRITLVSISELRFLSFVATSSPNTESRSPKFQSQN